MTATNKIILIGSILLFGGFVAIGAVSVQNYNQKSVASTAAVAVPTEKPTVAELLRLVNEERAKAGANPLIIDERLNKSAQQKADDMMTRNYYEHVDPEGRHGYDIAHEYAPEICIQPGENLIKSSVPKESSEIVHAWVMSEAHYTAMINSRYIYTGFGITNNKLVQHFC